MNGRVYVENGLALTTRNDREVYIEIRSLGTGIGSITGVWTIYFTPVARERRRGGGPVAILRVHDQSDRHLHLESHELVPGG